MTIPKAIRDRLGWNKDTRVCIGWDGKEVRIRHPEKCIRCPDITRLGSLGKIVIPTKVRTEAQIYRGQILSLDVVGDEVVVSAVGRQVRCQACGSEVDVKKVLPNVFLCPRCREALDLAAYKKAAFR